MCCNPGVLFRSAVIKHSGHDRQSFIGRIVIRNRQDHSTSWNFEKTIPRLLVQKKSCNVILALHAYLVTIYTPFNAPGVDGACCLLVMFG